VLRLPGGPATRNPVVQEALEIGVLREVTPAQASLSGVGGRLGNATTRAQVEEIAAELTKRGWTVVRGGGLSEEFIAGPAGGRLGSAYPDITVTKNGRVLRINTVDTLADGITPTPYELANAAKIRALRPGEHLILIPKKK
jgi:hypothetical protein